MQKFIVAHRGFANAAHENTLEAFSNAIGAGADWVELDVRKSFDNQLVVFHDEKISNKKISCLSYGQILNLASKQNFTVPTLTEALQLLAGKINVSIEIKESGFEIYVVEIARKYLPDNEFEIISFKPEVLKTMKRQFPEITVKLILGWGSRALPQLLRFLLQRKKVLSGIDGLCLNYHLVNLGFCRLISQNYPLTVWTVDDEKQIIKFLNHERINYLTSNRADLALNLKNNFLWAAVKC